MRFLIVHASSHGQTQAIAQAIAVRLRALGHTADVAAAAGPVPALAPYDAAVLGARIQFGKHARVMRRYVRDHRQELAARPTAFFSVSMSAAQAGAGADPNGYLAAFFEDVGWKPTHAIAFGGALRYRAYPWFLRIVMRSISRRGGHSTDTSRDHDYTDWAAVDRFAAGLVPAGLVPPVDAPDVARA